MRHAGLVAHLLDAVHDVVGVLLERVVRGTFERRARAVVIDAQPARELRIDVPGGLAVAGFDDVKEAGLTDPPLTTVAQDFDEVGRELIEQLLRHVDGEAARVRKVMLTAELIERGSTAAIR